MALYDRKKSEPKANEAAKKLIERVKDAARWRKDAKYDAVWSQLIRMYGNQYEYPELSQYQDVIAPNLIFSTINVIVPSIAINYPKITVTARQEDQQESALTVEAVANYYWRHFDVHDEFRAVIKDFSLIGHGWLKTTWAFSEEEVEMDPMEWQQALQQALMERHFAQQQAEQAGMTLEFPSDEEIIKSVPTKKTVVTEDRPAVDRISPFDMFVDTAATRLKDARWVAQRMYVPIEVARKNEEWDEKARQYLKPMALKREDVQVRREGEREQEAAEFAIVWEYYDLINKKFCVFSEGCEHFLIAPEDVPFAFAHPFVMVTNYSVPEKFYPIGDAETIAPLQLELAMTRTQMINDRKRFRRMYMYRPDAIGKDGVDSLLSDDDNAMIEVESAIPFADIIAPVATSSLPPEFYNQTAMILDDINMVSGVTEYQRGAVAEVRRTATEASMIQDASNARAADKLGIIERSIGEVAQRVVQLAQQFLTGEQVAKVVGDAGAVTWMPYTKEDIAGEYDFEVEAGSTQPQNETMRRQSALQMMDALQGFIGAGIVNPWKVAENVLKNGFGIKNPEEWLMPMPMAAPPGEGGQQGVSAETVPPGMPPMM
jgi:hypothetical protein